MPPSQNVSRPEALRRRIGWICHVLRVVAVVYVAWLLLVVFQHWAEGGRAAQAYSNWLRIDVSGMGATQRLLGFCVTLGIWVLVAAACVNLWRLCSGYLAGRIFTTGAATALGRIALFGLAAQFADIAARPLIAAIVTMHLPDGRAAFAFSLTPTDLLVVGFLLAFFALAHIYRAAAEMADDHAGII